MLFGRRKPGFAKEVELKPEDITDEFSDRNDPAMQRDSNPKAEKAEMAASAEAVMKGEVPVKAEEKPEKMDIYDYMESLPEVEDPFEPFDDTAQAENRTERKPEEVLAEYIRTRSAQAILTSKKELEKEEENLDELLKALGENENCKDILTVSGKKDVYYYSEDNMAHNYAMIAMLVAEKDIPATVVQMVRFNCKTYPSPTPLYYFMRSPYYMTKEQLDEALKQIERMPECADIRTTVAFNDVVYLYSTDIMSTRYAKALADGAEAGEADF